MFQAFFLSSSATRFGIRPVQCGMEAFAWLTALPGPATSMAGSKYSSEDSGALYVTLAAKDSHPTRLGWPAGFLDSVVAEQRCPFQHD